ncbi:glycosyltransferase family 2 protein [Aeromicrobium alkaliterrae]|uniref:Succinoglycan biosynthesis glycosyltransferase ExoM n=1 Tax=Aeromicrobium alkaliterrae TaxID=302168 RepID=A0ABN2JZZ1_9ACTN
MSDVPDRLVVVLVSALPRLNELRALLDSLASVRVPDRYRLRVVVVDNGVRPTVPDDRDGVTVVHEEAPGIVPARNRSIEVALAADPWAVAFVDDDEIVPAEWLTNLVEAQEKFSADVVTGPVDYVLPPGTPRTPAVARRFATLRHAHGPYEGTVATNNTLVLAHWFEGPSGLRFDPTFNGTGGEDVELFRRLRAQGGFVAWAPDSAVTELVPADRATPHALRQRALRNGQLEVRLRLLAHESTPRRQMVRAVYHGAKSTFRYAVLGLVVPRHRELGRLEISRALGYWKAAAGLRPFEEYERSDTAAR